MCGGVRRGIVGGCCLPFKRIVSSFIESRRPAWPADRARSLPESERERATHTLEEHMSVVVVARECVFKKHDLILSDARTHTTRAQTQRPSRPSSLPRANKTKLFAPMELCICVGLRLPPLISDGPGGSQQDVRLFFKRRWKICENLAKPKKAINYEAQFPDFLQDLC